MRRFYGPSLRNFEIAWSMPVEAFETLHSFCEFRSKVSSYSIIFILVATNNIFHITEIRRHSSWYNLICRMSGSRFTILIKMSPQIFASLYYPLTKSGWSSSIDLVLDQRKDQTTNTAVTSLTKTTNTHPVVIHWRVNMVNTHLLWYLNSLLMTNTFRSSWEESLNLSHRTLST